MSDPRVEAILMGIGRRTVFAHGDWAILVGDVNKILAAADAADPVRLAVLEILAAHKPVKHTDVSLRIRSQTVCWVCHHVLDEPTDWDEQRDGDWPYPSVQQSYPCTTVRLLASAVSS